MATSHDAVIDRVRAVCVASGLEEGPAALDFTRTPSQVTDAGQFVVRYAAQPGVGGLNFMEEARAVVDVQVLRPVQADPDAARRLVTQDLVGLLSAVVRDGASDGEYAVEDASRAMTMEQPKGAGYLVGTLRVAVNFEAQL